jgi:hypothetical protein
VNSGIFRTISRGNVPQESSAVENDEKHNQLQQ